MGDRTCLGRSVAGRENHEGTNRAALSGSGDRHRGTEPEAAQGRDIRPDSTALEEERRRMMISREPTIDDLEEILFEDPDGGWIDSEGLEIQLPDLD